MATPVQMTMGALPVPPQPITIEENSTIMKVLSCIPLLGIIPATIQDRSLALKITLEENASRLVELIKVKNQYKVANIVRNVITIALMVAGIALGLLSVGLGTVCASLLALAVGFYVYNIHENNKVINILQTTGVRPGLKVL